jgi:3-deoxy-manno-octulosonate cytidylyltransferase (CMP-KDO synthetase)
MRQANHLKDGRRLAAPSPPCSALPEDMSGDIGMAMPTIAIIVPCRLESTRFPRKLLHPIKGKPLLRWVAERIAAQAPAFPLWFAVDHELLRDAVAAGGFNAIMTSPAHASGTDRLAEANRTVRADHVINVQADEPLVTGAQIRELARLIGGDAPMATLATPFRRVVDFDNPNQVKVVLRRDGRALYFSRSRLPFSRDLGLTIDDAWVAAHPCYKHLGLYAYQAELLEKFPSLPPGRYEQIEKLEQLRVLENGYDIMVGLTEDPTIGVDTPEDAKKFEEWLG